MFTEKTPITTDEPDRRPVTFVQTRPGGIPDRISEFLELLADESPKAVFLPVPEISKGDQEALEGADDLTRTIISGATVEKRCFNAVAWLVGQYPELVNESRRIILQPYEDPMVNTLVVALIRGYVGHDPEQLAIIETEGGPSPNPELPLVDPNKLWYAGRKKLRFRAQQQSKGFGKLQAENVVDFARGYKKPTTSPVPAPSPELSADPSVETQDNLVTV